MATLSLAEIKKLLKIREKQIKELQAKRKKIMSALAAVDGEIAGVEGKGKRGRPAKKKAGKRGRPRKKMGKRGRPKKAAGKKARKKKAGRKKAGKKKAGKKKAAKKRGAKKRGAAKKKKKGLADYAVDALKKAGKPMAVLALAKAVEKRGYKSKNTAQVIRLTAGRGGKIKKLAGDLVKLG